MKPAIYLSLLCPACAPTVAIHAAERVAPASARQSQQESAQESDPLAKKWEKRNEARKRENREALRGMPENTAILRALLQEDVIFENGHRVERCHVAHPPPEPTSKAEIALTWEIAPDGMANKPRVKKRNGVSEKASECIIAEIQKWNFPPHDATKQRLSFPFVFE